MKRKFAVLAVTAAALSLVAVSVAGAAVILNDDPATGEFNGTGFVGKGDVQTPFGWNNKALQNNAAGVTFKWSSTEQRQQDCQTDTDEGRGRPRWTTARRPRQ